MSKYSHIEDAWVREALEEYKELTFDHLIPRSKGGLTNWENVVTACSHCNWTKGSKCLSQVGFKLLTSIKFCSLSFSTPLVNIIQTITNTPDLQGNVYA